MVHNVRIYSRPGGGGITCLQAVCECGDVLLDPSEEYTSSIGLNEIERRRWKHIGGSHVCPEGSGCAWCGT
jgi:hypothetical protein